MLSIYNMFNFSYLLIPSFLIPFLFLHQQKKKISSLLNTDLSYFQTISYISIFSKNYTISFLKKYFSHTYPLSKNYIKVGYYYHNTYYEIPIKVERGPKKFEILSIKNENNEIITNKILPLFGPDLNLYNLNITPKILGYKSINVFCSDQKNYFFDEKSVIKFD
jgi:hypothetical protein